MSRLLIKQHTPSNPDILKTFQINEKEIKTGVHCPKCSFLPLEKSKKGWYCPACITYDKHAHIEALKDYAYLINHNEPAGKRIFAGGFSINRNETAESIKSTIYRELERPKVYTTIRIL
ncbi:hypothetical protein ABES25_18720 [Bacillus gobiensis]|uniref:hypothetical protein n=1 Tax=Bacillus gobiensis TaxID=1441095 RepID=UPI003D1B9C82